MTPTAGVGKISIFKGRNTDRKEEEEGKGRILSGGTRLRGK